MRTFKQIQADIDAIRAKDRAYNRVVNEGGEGYNRDSVPAALYAERDAADAAAFAAEWTIDVFMARRAAWNAEVAKLGASINARQFTGLQDRLGYKLADIRKAKTMLGVQ